MTTTRTILLTGATGQVGAALLPLLRGMGTVVAPSRAEMDLADGASIRRVMRAVRPRWVVNPGAYTAVDRAESEEAIASAVNATAPGVLGGEARALGVPVIHVSTDYVFSGEGDAAWRETDATGPLSVYGRSKLAGEEALAASGAAHVTLRTSWVYAAAGQNFLRTMLRLGRQRDTLRVVDDQFGTPTAAGDLAAAILAVMRALEAEAAGVGQTTPDGVEARSVESNVDALCDAVRARGGVLHAAGAGEATTWFGFAEAIFALASETQPGTRLATLEPIATAEYPTPARRPRNSRLDCSLLANTFGYKMPEWRGSLQRVMREVFAAEEVEIRETGRSSSAAQTRRSEQAETAR